PGHRRLGDRLRRAGQDVHRRLPARHPRGDHHRHRAGAGHRAGRRRPAAAGRAGADAVDPGAGGSAMSYFGWLFDPAHWAGPQGVPQRLVEHLGYTALTLLIAIVIAVPLGAWIGHTGRGGFLVVGLANGLRALPTLGLLVLLVGAIGIGLLGPLIALVVLAVPPILA